MPFMPYSINLNYKLRKDYYSGKYQVWCMSCGIMISSYNYEPYAVRAKHSNKNSNNSPHRNHDIKVKESV